MPETLTQDAKIDRSAWDFIYGQTERYGRKLAIEMACKEYNAVTIAAFCLDKDMAEWMYKDLKARDNSGEMITIDEAIDLYEDEIWSQLQEGSTKHNIEPDPDEVDPEFKKDLEATMDNAGIDPFTHKSNPLQTKAFAVSYTNAIAAGLSRQEAQAVAWDAWKSRKMSIVSVNPQNKTAVLEDGRRITARILKLKIANDEIELKDGQLEKITKVFSEAW
jgi:hypothetical protein